MKLKSSLKIGLRAIFLTTIVILLLSPAGLQAQLSLDWDLDLTHLQPGSPIPRNLIQMGSDGGVYIAYIDNGIGLIKIRPDKSIAFHTVYTCIERPYELLVGPSGECYVIAGQEVNGEYDHFITIRFDPGGVVSWLYTWGNRRVSNFNVSGVDYSGNLWIATGDFVFDAPCLDSTLQAVLMKGTPAGMSVVNTYRGPVGNGGVAPYILNPICASPQGNVSFILNEGYQCYALDCDPYPPYCYVDQYGDSTWNWSQIQVRTHTPGGGLANETVLYTSSDPSLYEDQRFSIDYSTDGGLITLHEYRPDPEVWAWNTSVKHNSWTTVLPDRKTYGPLVDHNGDIYVTTETVDNSSPPGDTESAGLTVPTLYKLSGTTGTILWSHTWWSHQLAIDLENNIYTSDGKVDPNGNLLWGWPNLGYDGSIATFVGIDDDNNHYHFDGNTKVLHKFMEDNYLVIKDARGDSLPSMEFELWRVSYDVPYFSETLLGTFTTNESGRLDLERIVSDTFRVLLNDGETIVAGSDSLKVSRHVQSIPAVKHEGVLSTMYSVHLDNAKFDDNGGMYFNTYSDREIILDHTELRYNLLVVVEWEATEDYLYQLESNFMQMSNYLYDVTDGQLRLDTVMIFDNNDFSMEADMYILASNYQWPCAEPGGILRNATNPQTGISSSHIWMPRIWMGDSTRTWDYTGSVYPLNLVNPSIDFRTKAHEFGHYALNFLDEYLFWSEASGSFVTDDEGLLRCHPVSYFRYGFMDFQYASGGAMASEMSSGTRYLDEACRNTNQYITRGKSCWDHLESWVEAVGWGPDNLHVPILKPDAIDENERVVTNPGGYFAGPNDDLSNPDYEVGIKVVFPVGVNTQAAGYSDKHVTVHHSQGGDGAKITLMNNPYIYPGAVIIEQGRSSQTGEAWVIGVKDASYEIMATKKGTNGTVVETNSLAAAGIAESWLYGLASSGSAAPGRKGFDYSISVAGDSITMELREAQGVYPLVMSAELNELGVDYSILASQPFDSVPKVDISLYDGSVSSQGLTEQVGGYSAQITDTLGDRGSITLWAYDDSTEQFFVPADYRQKVFDHTQPLVWFFGADGQCEIRLDSNNTALQRGLILSTAYPVPRTGISESAVQAGQVHSISVYPDNQLQGVNQIVLRYADQDLMIGDSLMGDEYYLSAHRWLDASTGWVAVPGAVDTAKNEIYAAITEPGVYAAFTTSIITGIGEMGTGDILPYGFELSQNYPNPFNPVTTIEYRLPERSHVTIEVYNIVGQKLRTLVDREAPAGSFTVTWSGDDDTGNPVATGVYLYRFEAGEQSQTKKMLLLK